MKTEPDPTGNEHRRRFVLQRYWAVALIGLLVPLLSFVVYCLVFDRLTDFFYYEDHSYSDYLRGVDLFNRGDYNEVIRVMEESIRNRERHYAALGNSSDAETDLQLARNERLLGVALSRQGRQGQAVDHLIRAKGIYEGTRALWKDDPQIASELADTLSDLKSAQETLSTGRVSGGSPR